MHLEIVDDDDDANDDDDNDADDDDRFTLDDVIRPLIGIFPLF